MKDSGNGDAGQTLPPAHGSASWAEEIDFWYRKGSRAFIRYNKAMERGDNKAAELAMQQHALCKRRIDAVAVPQEVLEEWRKKDEAEELAAMEEI